MEHEKWVISDTHFFHHNTWLKFKDGNGNPLRPFESTKEMHETLMRNWNSVVGVNDYVYHLGDVTFDYGKDFNNFMSQLNGRKRLILGNHDKIKGTNLLDWFEKVELWKGFADKDDWHGGIHNPGFTMTHIPIPLAQLRDGDFNVHGHTHSNCLEDQHYVNVCVEQINYTPLHFDQLFAIINERKKDFKNRDTINKKLNT